MKYKITTAKNAVKKGLVNIGDEIWIKVKVESTDYEKIGYKATNKIRIPIPEPKPINFGQAGRVLKSSTFGTIIQTTGLQVNENFFSAFVLDKANSNWAKGQTSDYFLCDEWQDITDTYKK